MPINGKSLCLCLGSPITSKGDGKSEKTSEENKPKRPPLETRAKILLEIMKGPISRVKLKERFNDVSTKTVDFHVQRADKSLLKLRIIKEKNNVLTLNITGSKSLVEICNILQADKKKGPIISKAIDSAFVKCLLSSFGDGTNPSLDRAVQEANNNESHMKRIIRLTEEGYFDKGAITERIFSKNDVRAISELVKKFSELEKTHEGNMGIDLEEIRNVKGLMPEYLLDKALYLSQEVRGKMTLARKIRYILFVIGNIREVEECYRVNILGREYLELSSMNTYEKRGFIEGGGGPYCEVWNFMLNTIKTDDLERGAEVRIMSYPELITIFFEKILKNVALNNVYDFEIEDALLSEGKDVKEAIQSISSVIEAVGVDHNLDLVSDPFESGFAKEVISGYKSVMAGSDKLNTEELNKAVLLNAYLKFIGSKLSRYSETFKRIKENVSEVPGRSKTFI